MADDAGAQLFRAGLIPKAALDQARGLKRRGGGTILERLVELGAIDDEALTRFVSEKFMVPRVDPGHMSSVPLSVRDRLAADLAVELRAIPVAVDREGNLTCALSDPSDKHTVEQIAFFTGAHVLRAVCTQMQLAWALAHYYGHLTDLGRSLAVSPEPGGVEPATPSDFAHEPTGETMPVKRLVRDELAPRSGEITMHVGATPTPVRLPAVVVEDLEDLVGPDDGVEARVRGQIDGEAVPGEVRDDVVLLHAVKAERGSAATADPGRPRRDTDVGAMKKSATKKNRGGKRQESGGESIAPAPAAPAPASAAAAPTTTAAPTAPAPEPAPRSPRREPRLTPVDEGWDMDGWGPPGQTIPPPLLGAVPGTFAGADSSRIPLAIDDASSGVVSSPVIAAPATARARTEPPIAEGLPTEKIQIVQDQAVVDASAARLLVALRAIDAGDSRDAVVAAALTFLAGTTPRAGFAALKNGRLTGYRGPNDIARGGDVDLLSGPLGEALGRSTAYQGAISGPEAIFAANLVGSHVSAVAAAPVVVRSRLVGTFVAELVPDLVEEHLVVVARAAGLALERVLKATKR